MRVVDRAALIGIVLLIIPGTIPLLLIGLIIHKLARKGREWVK